VSDSDPQGGSQALLDQSIVESNKLIKEQGHLLRDIRSVSIRDVMAKLLTLLSAMVPVTWDKKAKAYVSQGGDAIDQQQMIELTRENLRSVFTPNNTPNNSSKIPKEGNDNMSTISFRKFTMGTDNESVSIDMSELSDKKAEAVLSELGLVEYKKASDLKDGQIIRLDDKTIKVMKRGEKFWLVVAAVAGAAIVVGVLGTLGVQWALGDATETAGSGEGAHLQAM